LEFHAVFTAKYDCDRYCANSGENCGIEFRAMSLDRVLWSVKTMLYYELLA